MSSTNVKANWISDQYVVTDTGTENEWYSIDGSEWCDQNGKAVTDDRFNEARIVLCGGPNDGEIVE